MQQRRNYRNPHNSAPTVSNGQPKPFKAKNTKMAHKGKAFEKIIDGACLQYKTRNIAHIDRIPTPVEIKKVTGKNVTGVLSTAKFTDYMGILNNGRGIAIEAKECSTKNAFPLSQLETHQYNLLKIYHKMGGVAFLLVYRVHYKKVYRVPFEVLERIWEATKTGGKKSIPQTIFETECAEVKPNYKSSLDFLEGVV